MIRLKVEQTIQRVSRILGSLCDGGGGVGATRNANAVEEFELDRDYN